MWFLYKPQAYDYRSMQLLYVLHVVSQIGAGACTLVQPTSQGFRRDDLPKIDTRVREECAGVRGIDATAGTTQRSPWGVGR